MHWPTSVWGRPPFCQGHIVTRSNTVLSRSDTVLSQLAQPEDLVAPWVLYVSLRSVGMLIASIVLPLTWFHPRTHMLIQHKIKPLRAEPNGFLVHLLSHSDTVCSAKSLKFLRLMSYRSHPWPPCTAPVLQIRIGLPWFLPPYSLLCSPLLFARTLCSAAGSFVAAAVLAKSLSRSGFAWAFRPIPHISQWQGLTFGLVMMIMIIPKIHFFSRFGAPFAKAQRIKSPCISWSSCTSMCPNLWNLGTAQYRLDDLDGPGHRAVCRSVDCWKLWSFSVVGSDAACGICQSGRSSAVGVYQITLYIDTHTYIHACMHTDRQTDRRTDGQTDRRTDGQTDRQTDRRT